MNSNTSSNKAESGFNLYIYSEPIILKKVIYPIGRILILKKDVISIIGINRKTLNTLIKRGKQNIFAKKMNGEVYLDLNEVLLYAKKHREKKGNK